MIDKIVYSLWTRPSKKNLLESVTNWKSPKAHIYCLALSVLRSSEFFDEVELVTDSAGYDILKKIKLPFTSVDLKLDEIDEAHRDFWALGKIYAYKEQEKPFIHLDNDAILWQGLPDWGLNSTLFVQNTEDKDWFKGTYTKEITYCNKVLEYFPKNWNITQEAFCTGIFGGNDVAFIQLYCNEVLKFLHDSKNQEGWKSIANKGSYCVVFEQYILACLAHYHNIDITFFDKHLDQEKLATYGYTHIWGAKKDDAIEEKLGTSLQQHYPEVYHQINSELF